MAVNAMIHRHENAAWQTWRDAHGDARRELATLHRGVQKMRNRKLARGFVKWRFENAMGLDQQRSMRGCLNRMRQSKLTAAFNRWREQYLDSMRQLALIRKSLSAIRHRTLFQAWRCWRESYLLDKETQRLADRKATLDPKPSPDPNTESKLPLMEAYTLTGRWGFARPRNTFSTRRALAPFIKCGR